MCFKFKCFIQTYTKYNHYKPDSLKSLNHESSAILSLESYLSRKKWVQYFFLEVCRTYYSQNDDISTLPECHYQVKIKQESHNIYTLRNNEN